MPLITFDDFSNLDQQPEQVNFGKYKRFKSVPNVLDSHFLSPNYTSTTKSTLGTNRHVREDPALMFPSASTSANLTGRRFSTQLQRRRESLAIFNLMPAKDKMLEFNMNAFDGISEKNEDEDERAEERERFRDQVRLYANMRKRRSLIEKQNAMFGKVHKKASRHSSLNDKAFQMLDHDSSRRSSLHRKSSNASQMLDTPDEGIYIAEYVKNPVKLAVRVQNLIQFIDDYLSQLPNGYFVIVGLFFVITLSICASFIRLVSKSEWY